MEDSFVYDDIVQDYIPDYYSQFLRELLVPLLRYSSQPGVYKAKDREGNIVDACARYANERLRALGYDIYGHAWSRMRGMNKIYSGYDNIKDQRPTTYNKAALNKYNKMAAEEFKKHVDINSLRDNDIVSIYYNNSRALQQAYDEGINGNTNTHTGNIVMINGVPYVDHNIDGTAYIEPLEKLLGGRGKYGITEVWRPMQRLHEFNMKPIQWNYYENY